MASVTAGFQTRDRHVEIVSHPPNGFVLAFQVYTQCKNKRIVLFEIHGCGPVTEPDPDNERLADKITSYAEGFEFILHFKNYSWRNYEFIEQQIGRSMKYQLEWQFVRIC